MIVVWGGVDPLRMCRTRQIWAISCRRWHIRKRRQSFPQTAQTHRRAGPEVPQRAGIVLLRRTVAIELSDLPLLHAACPRPVSASSASRWRRAPLRLGRRCCGRCAGQPQPIGRRLPTTSSSVRPWLRMITHAPVTCGASTISPLCFPSTRLAKPLGPRCSATRISHDRVVSSMGGISPGRCLFFTVRDDLHDLRYCGEVSDPGRPICISVPVSPPSVGWNPRSGGHEQRASGTVHGRRGGGGDGPRVVPRRGGHRVQRHHHPEQRSSKAGVDTPSDSVARWGRTAAR